MSDVHHQRSSAQKDIPALLRRAARERERGHFRQAMALYKRAAFDTQDRPGLWTRYALSCVSAGQSTDGARAFSQAIWLLERQGRKRGADVTRELAEIAGSGRLPDNYARRPARPWQASAWRAAAHCAFARRHPTKGYDSAPL